MIIVTHAGINIFIIAVIKDKDIFDIHKYLTINRVMSTQGHY